MEGHRAGGVSEVGEQVATDYSRQRRLLFEGAEPEQLSLPFESRPRDILNSEFRDVNENHPPNVRANELLQNESYRKAVIKDTCYDCSEIVDNFYRATNGEGIRLRFEPKLPGKLITPEAGRTREYFYHEVYSDGRYIYDPRLSSKPIPRGDYLRLMRKLNPDGFEVIKQDQ
jgi:hypothetical protein